MNGAERAWKAAQHYTQQKVDFLCLQEVKLTPEKANSFMCMAPVWPTNIILQYVRFELGERKTNAQGRMFWPSGIAVFVPFRHPTRLAATWWRSEAQFVRVDVCNVQLVCVYVRPNCRDPEKVWNNLHDGMRPLFPCEVATG